jgi:hypothetical protein
MVRKQQSADRSSSTSTTNPIVEIEHLEYPVFTEKQW